MIIGMGTFAIALAAGVALAMLLIIKLFKTIRNNRPVRQRATSNNDFAKPIEPPRPQGFGARPRKPILLRADSPSASRSKHPLPQREASGVDFAKPIETPRPKGFGARPRTPTPPRADSRSASRNPLPQRRRHNAKPASCS